MELRQRTPHEGEVKSEIDAEAGGAHEERANLYIGHCLIHK